MTVKRDLLLAIDVGTGSVRAALLDRDGNTVAFASREHEQHVPHFGWSEQRPRDWWQGTVASVREALERSKGAAERIAAVGICGQMHGTVPLDDGGQVLSEYVQLWNDKRADEQVDALCASLDDATLARFHALAANPPAPSWPGFKIAWMKAHQPEVYNATSCILTPKDYINFCFTDARGTDVSEASCSFVMDAAQGAWSQELAVALGIDADKLPAIHESAAVIGTVQESAERACGLPAGIPVVAGGGDFPVSLLGAGLIGPGLASDITGTSTLISAYRDRPIIDDKLSNVRAVSGGWVPFTLIDAGGDSMRWARWAFHDNELSYAEVVERARAVPAGAEGLLFLPYLNGERIGSKRGGRRARAQFFGLARGHGNGHLHRAVMEGVALAAYRHMREMERAGCKFEQIVASGGGAKDPLWLQIKADVYNVPVVVPANVESGILGCAILAGVGAGIFATAAEAARRLVRYEGEYLPQPAQVERYRKAAALFDRLYELSGPLYAELDAL